MSITTNRKTLKLVTICSLLACSVLCSTMHGKDLDILIFSPQESYTGYEGGVIASELNSMLTNTPGYTESSASYQLSLGRSLVETFHHPEDRPDTETAFTGKYDYVVLVEHSVFTRYMPEVVFEGAQMLSREFLNRGTTPLLLVSAETTNYISYVGENSYRIANGCGIETLPGGYAALSANLVEPGPLLDHARQAYLVAALIYTHLTGMNAVDSGYDPPDVSGSPIDHTNLANIAEATWSNHMTTIHYADDGETNRTVRHRTLDLNQAPMNGTGTFFYVGTSTETGFRNHIQPILTASGFTPGYVKVSNGGGSAKDWNTNDFNLAKPHFDTRDDKVFLAYARGAECDAQPMIDYDQAHLLPTTFDRHFDDIGSGPAAMTNILDDVHHRSYSLLLDKYYYDWGGVPFHLAAGRLHEADPSIVACNDGTHVTTPLNYMVAAMFITSALGIEPTPSATVLGNADYLTAFNVGIETVQELAYLSETKTYTPDSNLKVTRERLPIATTTVGFNHALSAQGGTPPYTWEEVSDTGLPSGLTLSSNGVLSGSASDTPGLWNLVFRVKDSNGSIRKLPFPLLVEDVAQASYSNWAAYVFDNTGLPASEQETGGDPDGDNVSNLVEYAMGGNALTADPASVLGVLTSSVFQVEYVRRAGGTAQPDGTYSFNDLAYTVETTDHLPANTWTNVSGLITGIQTSDLSNSYESASITISNLPPGEDIHSFRLRIDYAE